MAEETEAEILANNKYLDRYVKCYACGELHFPQDAADHEISTGVWAMICDPCAKVLELEVGK